MLSCLLAKRLGANYTIARVRNPIYYEQIDLLKEDLHLSMAVNPELETANEIMRVLSFSAVTKVESFVKGRVELIEFPLKKGTPLDGLILKELYRKHQVKALICAVSRGSNVFIPDGEFVLQAGDKLNIVASHLELERFFRAIGQKSMPVRNVLIIGGGHISYYLAKELLKLRMRVKIIDEDYQRCEVLCEALPEATIINGSARDHELLIEEGIREADVLVSLVGNDELNMLTALYAYKQGVKKIIAKVNEEDMTDMVDAMGIDSVVSPKSVTADRILSYVRARQNSFCSANVETMYHLVNGQIEALEFFIGTDAKYIHIPLKDLPIKSNHLVAAIVRGRDVIIPNGNDVIKAGDSVVIVTKNKKIQRMEDIFTDTGLLRTGRNGKEAK